MSRHAVFPGFISSDSSPRASSESPDAGGCSMTTTVVDSRPANAVRRAESSLDDRLPAARGRCRATTAPPRIGFGGSGARKAAVGRTTPTRCATCDEDHRWQFAAVKAFILDTRILRKEMNDAHSHCRSKDTAEVRWCHPRKKPRKCFV